MTAMTLLFAVTMMAQTTTVKGVVVNKSLGEGEPFVTVRVFRKGDSQAVEMFLTDDSGRFSRDITGSGAHEITFNSIGKNELRREITLGQQAVIDLGTLYLDDNAETLHGVEVIAQKPLVKMETDKMSYRVEDDEDAKSNTLLDMLRKVPMVTVDGQDNITVNGSSSFKVYVDGKPNVMFSSNPSMVMKSIPASAVKTIEVITNPGAKYDAEGASGVLNIVMNRQQGAPAAIDGFNGTIRANAGTSAMGGGTFVSGQKGKLTYSANANFTYSTPGETIVESEQENGPTTITSTSEMKTRLPFTMANIALGYELDTASQVNTSLSVTNMLLRNEGRYTTAMGGSAYAKGFDYASSMNMKNRNTSFSWNIDYQRFLNPARNKSITLSYQLSVAPTKNELNNDFDPYDQSPLDLTDRFTSTKSNTTEHTFQVDYTMPLAQGHALNTGAKFMLRNASSDSKYYLNDVYTSNLSMDYLYKNTIAAGYAEYEGTWNKIGTKAGLRYEHTWQDVEYKMGNGENFSTNYGAWVPSASLSYSLAPTSNIGLTYNLRISRPGITYLNPYVDRSDPNSLSYGNTDLDVEKSHNMSLVYNMFTPKLMLNVNLRYSYLGNAIEQYSFLDNNLLNTTYGNIVRRNQTGITVYANWLAHKNTRIFINGGVNYTDLSSSRLNLSSSGWQANAMAGIQQTLPWNLKMGAFVISSSKTYTLQGWSSGFNLLTANLSKSFLNDKLTVSVMGLTGLSDGGRLKMESFSSGNNFSQHQNIKINLSGVTFTVSYTFGKSRQQQRQHMSRIQNDYIEQKSQGEIINSVGDMGQP